MVLFIGFLKSKGPDSSGLPAHFVNARDSVLPVYAEFWRPKMAIYFNLRMRYVIEKTFRHSPSSVLKTTAIIAIIPKKREGFYLFFGPKPAL